MNIKSALLVTVFIVLCGAFASNVLAQGSKSKNASAFSPPAAVQQPLYSDYKGVRIGMTDQEVHAKLGSPLKIDDVEFYVFSDNETAQVAYDAQKKVTAISVDYAGGTGAPDYKNVVGPNIDVRPDGSMYKIVHYEQLGFWVSYNRTGKNTPVTTVSVTIQKILH